MGDNSKELPYRTATELAKALADRSVSARELADAAIARIEALDRRREAADAALTKGKSPLAHFPALAHLAISKA